MFRLLKLITVDRIIQVIGEVRPQPQSIGLEAGCNRHIIGNVALGGKQNPLGLTAVGRINRAESANQT